MNTNILLSMDKRRMKTDGTYPIVLRLGHEGLTRCIPLGLSMEEKYWNETDRIIKSTYKDIIKKSISEENSKLRKKREAAIDIINKLDKAGQLQGMNINELKEKIEKHKNVSSFFIYTEMLVEELKKANRVGTAKSYHGVTSVLKTFNDGKDLSFSQINYNFLKAFETAHLEKGNAYNGLAVYMRTIRAIYNRAVKEDIIEAEHYPFDKYKIKTTPTDKRALDWEFIKKIIETQIAPGQLCFNARNYFLASYMMYGMNYTDMAYLKKSDITNGRINYRRRKTSKIYDIKITPQLQEILTYYTGLHPTSPYIFPILKRESAILQDKDIQWARKRYNKRLKDLADLCEIKTNLTSYVSRHSFATQAMLQEVPLNAISTMLGHSSLKTTEVYLKSLPSNILDDYNLKIMASNSLNT